MIKTKIDQLISETKDKTSILIWPIDQQHPLYEKDSEVQMVSASTIKLFILCTALHEVMLNQMHLDQKIQVLQTDILEDTHVFEHGPDTYTLEELLSWMIITSDNTATNVMIRTLGMKKINDYIQNVLQLKQTKLERIMLDYEAIQNGLNNYTSQKDQRSTYLKLFHHEILNDELCEKALEILYNLRDQDLIMRYIPFKTAFAHKVGGLDYLIHDCGIMTINETTVYIGVSAWDCEDIDGNRALAGKIGRLVYDYYKNGSHN